MNRKRWLVVGVVAAIVMVGLWRFMGMQPRSGDGQEHGTAPVHKEREGENGKHADEQEHVLRIPAAALKANDVQIGTAAPGVIEEAVTLPGEVVLNPDRVVHVMARVTGTAREVLKTVGDEVRPGELLAVLDSRTLADAKSTYQVARERLTLAETLHTRAQDLRQKQIIAEKEYLEARQKLAETEIELRAAERNLHALGLGEDDVQRLAAGDHTDITRYEIRAPIAGIVLERHLVLGELLQESVEAFKLADLSSVWVQLSIYGNDVALVQRGQPVELRSTDGKQHAVGEVDYVNPLIQEQTRTGLARVVLPNPQRAWRPGQFVTARIVVASDSVQLVIPDAAVQRYEGHPVVFVETPEGFAVREIAIGRTDGVRLEVLSGVSGGERLVVANSFLFKAELGKESAGHAH